MKSSNRATTRVWDLPTRLFHWLFAAAVIGAIVTVKVGGTWMDWHPIFGVTALVLLTFRVIWGFTGSRYARFSSFVKGPRTVWHYLRHPEERSPPGHSPLGGLSVVALLLVVAVQAGTGLFATDDILTSGPLNQFVSSDTAALLTSIHKWNENVLFGLVGLHLVAIAIYALRGKQLVPPHDYRQCAVRELAKRCSGSTRHGGYKNLGPSADFGVGLAGLVAGELGQLSTNGILKSR